MPDPDRWLLPLVVAGFCAAVMALLVAGIALALGTSGHDWYAVWKLTLAEAMLGVGFDDNGPVDYRTADGETAIVARRHLAYGMYEPWLARRLIFSLAADRAVLGACTGLVLFTMWMGVRAVVGLRRFASGRRTVVERRSRVRRRYEGRMYGPDDWSDGELIAALARRNGGYGVLLVPADEVHRLAGRGGYAAEGTATPQDPLPVARTPGASPPESAEPAPADPGSRPDTTKADMPPGRKAVVRRREPGRLFF